MSILDSRAQWEKKKVVSLGLNIDTSELGRYHQEAFLVHRFGENILSWRESPFSAISTVPSSQDEGGW